MNKRVARLLNEILRLSAAELNELKRGLEDPPPDAGVREPVAPRPPSPKEGEA